MDRRRVYPYHSTAPIGFALPTSHIVTTRGAGSLIKAAPLYYQRLPTQDLSRVLNTSLDTVDGGPLVIPDSPITSLPSAIEKQVTEKPKNDVILHSSDPSPAIVLSPLKVKEDEALKLGREEKSTTTPPSLILPKEQLKRNLQGNEEEAQTRTHNEKHHKFSLT